VFIEFWLQVERKLGELTMQERAFLDAHNEFRSITALGNTGSQPMATDMTKLKWNDEIAYGAEEYAAQCNFAHDNTDYGENLYATASTIDNLDSVEKMTAGVRSWYNEHSDYTHDTTACSGVCGHYTQAVWAKSLSVGCGYSMCTNIFPGYPYQMMIVCRYSPRGNYIGDKPYTETGEPGAIATDCPVGYTGNSATGLCETSDTF